MPQSRVEGRSYKRPLEEDSLAGQGWCRRAEILLRSKQKDLPFWGKQELGRDRKYTESPRVYSDAGRQEPSNLEFGEPSSLNLHSDLHAFQHSIL